MLEPASGLASLGMPSPAGGPLGSASFTIDGLMAGEYVLRISGAVVRSITWDGQDYTDRPFDASAGRDFTDVVVTVTTAASSLSGVVNDSGAGVAAAVIAYPVERERWSNYGLNPTRLRAVLTNSEGRFRIDGLPIGEYYLVAVPPAQERAWLDPAFLASRAARASRVRIDRGDAVIVNLTLGMVK